MQPESHFPPLETIGDVINFFSRRDMARHQSLKADVEATGSLFTAASPDAFQKNTLSALELLMEVKQALSGVNGRTLDQAQVATLREKYAAIFDMPLSSFAMQSQLLFFLVGVSDPLISEQAVPALPEQSQEITGEVNLATQETQTDFEKDHSQTHERAAQLIELCPAIGEMLADTEVWTGPRDHQFIRRSFLESLFDKKDGQEFNQLHFSQYFIGQLWWPAWLEMQGQDEDHVRMEGHAFRLDRAAAIDFLYFIQTEKLAPAVASTDKRRKKAAYCLTQKPWSEVKKKVSRK